ncbi:MAG: hypothetical protein A2096_08905 [Spirochaetes bacterium GWF1_41_5]|nr:MAG: hypothetical protein A2096_08905 [Spirochaetes bacterium GWF1_41_5]HBE01945.1 hypothetical protein [Spirochaetia bacterium]
MESIKNILLKKLLIFWKTVFKYKASRRFWLIICSVLPASAIFFRLAAESHFLFSLVKALTRKNPDFFTWQHWNYIFSISAMFAAVFCFLTGVLILESWRCFAIKIISNNKAFTALFIAVFFLFRIVPAQNPFTGEDGMFADVFLSHPPNPEYLQIGRIDGKTIYTHPQHPAIMYEILGYTGDFLKKIIPYNKTNVLFNFNIIRLSFSLFQLTVWIGLLFIIHSITHVQSLLARVMLLIMANTPMAVNNSIDIQMDTSIGILSAGVLGWALLGRLHPRPSVLSWIGLFTAGIFIGIGKNEWTALLFASSLLFFTAWFILKEKTNVTRNVYISIALLLAGCLLGNIWGYLYDAPNYLGGWKLLNRMKSSHSVINAGALWQWLAMTRGRLPFIVPQMFLMLLAGYFFIIHKKYNWVLLFAMACSVVYFGAFFFSSWGDFVRYFAPSYIFLAVTVIIGLQISEIIPRPRLVITAVCIIFTLVSVIYIALETFRMPGRLDAYTQYQQKMIAADGKLMYTDSSYTFNKKVDYIQNNLDFKDAEAIAEKYQKKLHRF